MQEVLGIAAALTLVSVHREIAQMDVETWVGYLPAFQNGFFWEAALDAVVRVLREKGSGKADL